MFIRSVRYESGSFLKKGAFALIAGILGCALPLGAQTAMPVSVGAGMRTSFVHTGRTSPITGSNDRFLLESARIYLNGTAAPDIKFTFNTEYDGASNKIGVLDAIARYEPSAGFNLWMGRLLPPSDRANLHGPYYAHEWASYTDSIQDGYPTIATGRDNGFVYWGDYGKVKVSAGAFDGPTTSGSPKVITAARLQVNFWDPESGYYLNGTYYGGKKLLSLGGAIQNQSGNTATTADFLAEKKLSGGGVVSLQSEFSYYDKLGGWDSSYGLSRGAFLLGSYMFPQKIGMGQVEILGKFAEASFAKGVTPANIYYKQKTSEANLSYIIKEFNARVTAFYTNKKFTAVKNDVWTIGLGVQIQM